MKSFISSLILEDVKGLVPRWGSAAALMRAATVDLSLLSAARNRGENWFLFNRLTLHPAPIRTVTTAGFQAEAKCKGDLWSLFRASTLAPAWTRVFTTVVELLYRAARCRGVSWVGNRVEKQIKNYWPSLHQCMIYLKSTLVLICPSSYSF